MNTLKIRLFLMLLIFTGLSLFGFGGMIYTGIKNNLEESEKHKLYLITQAIIKDIHPEQNPLYQEENPIPSNTNRPGIQSSIRLLIAVWDSSGTLLYQSLWFNSNSVPYRPHKRHFTHYERFIMEEGNVFSALWTTYLPAVMNDSSNRPIEYVQPGTPGSFTLLTAYQDDEFDAYLRTVLFWLWMGGITVSAAISFSGLFGIAWALSPFYRLMREIVHIDARTLSYRIGNSQTPKEMQSAVDIVNQLLEKLETAFTREKQFSSDAAHELSTPLSAIRCMAETAAMKSCEQTSHLNSFRQITQISFEMGEIVENLLLLARTEDCQTVPDAHPANLVEVISEMVDAIMPETVNRNIDLEWNPPDETIVIDGHEGWLQRMFFNLLSNAVRFNRDQGRIEITLHKMQDWLEISVRDTGIGIPDEIQEKIFERFYRAEKARDRISGGVGLGLSLSRSIARIHGGDITVNSVLGEGSVFIVHLPCKVPLLQPHST